MDKKKNPYNTFLVGRMNDCFSGIESILRNKEVKKVILEYYNKAVYRSLLSVLVDISKTLVVTPHLTSRLKILYTMQNECQPFWEGNVKGTVVESQTRCFRDIGVKHVKVEDKYFCFGNVKSKIAKVFDMPAKHTRIFCGICNCILDNERFDFCNAEHGGNLIAQWPAEDPNINLEKLPVDEKISINVREASDGLISVEIPSYGASIDKFKEQIASGFNHDIDDIAMISRRNSGNIKTDQQLAVLCNEDVVHVYWKTPFRS